jgi:peptidoglycan/LPS O-acetylase OafA/YrhL
MRSRSLNYMPALDGLRAVAVLMVFAVHAFPESGFPGGLGVDVFFVISGFLITRILLAELERTDTIALRFFYTRRLLRLYPALLTVTAVVLGFYVVRDGGWPQPEVIYAGVAVLYLSNIYMTVTGHLMEPLTHTWSLATEEQFYLLWPLVLLSMHRLALSRRTMSVLLAVATAVCVAAWGVTSDQHLFIPLVKIGELLVGCLAAVLVAKRPWYSAVAGYVSAAVFVVVVLAFMVGGVDQRALMPIVVATVPFVVLLCAFGDGPLVTALGSPLLAHLGVVSYGLYLWHYPILLGLQSRGIEGWSGATLGLGVTLAATELSFRLIERPVLAFKDRLTPSDSLRARAGTA